MDSATLNTMTCSMFPRKISPKLRNPNNIFSCGFGLDATISTKIYAISSNNGAPPSPSASQAGKSGSGGRRISSVEALFCYDKAIPEERIEKPVGISLGEKVIGDNPKCIDCQAKGAVLCTTCSGCGLYVDSIMESQGILVKVRCLGCGGTGNIMCSECGGRGHVGPK